MKNQLRALLIQVSQRCDGLRAFLDFVQEKQRAPRSYFLIGQNRDPLQDSLYFKALKAPCKLRTLLKIDRQARIKILRTKTTNRVRLSDLSGTSEKKWLPDCTVLPGQKEFFYVSMHLTANICGQRLKYNHILVLQ